MNKRKIVQDTLRNYNVGCLVLIYVYVHRQIGIYRIVYNEDTTGTVLSLTHPHFVDGPGHFYLSPFTSSNKRWTGLSIFARV